MAQNLEALAYFVEINGHADQWRRNRFPENVADHFDHGEETPQDRIDRLQKCYKGAIDDSAVFLTPEFQTKFWQDMLADDPSIVLSRCDWSEEEIHQPIVDMWGNQIKNVMLVPALPVLLCPGLTQLGERYPYLSSWSVQKGTSVADTHATLGFVKVEAVHRAPNLGTNEYQIRNHLANHKQCRVSAKEFIFFLERRLWF